MRKVALLYHPAPFLILAVLSPTITIATPSPVYTSGVNAGDWASYSPVNVTYYGTKAYAVEPQYVKDLNAIDKITDTVERVYQSTNVTIKSTIQYGNSTTQTEILNGDLLSGLGNLTFRLISGGLSAGKAVWPGYYNPTINQTVSRNYLGISRTVNILNLTETPPNLVVNFEYVWDQQTGIILENKTLTILPRLALDGGFVLYTDFRIQSTTIFSNPTSPDFTVLSSTPASVTTGTSAKSTITIAATNGFTGTVTLSVAIPYGLTCDPITPRTITGSGTADLSCRSSNAGNYTVTITATYGSTTHTTTTTMAIAAGSNPTPNSTSGTPNPAPISPIFYAIVGVAVLISASTGVYLFLRTRSERRRKTATVPST